LAHFLALVLAKEWSAEVESILHAHPDHLAIAMDCHG